MHSVITAFKRVPMANPAAKYQLFQPPDADLAHEIGIFQFHEK
jgi:hypothetical protein